MKLPPCFAYQVLFGSFYKYGELVSHSCTSYIVQCLGAWISSLLQVKIHASLDCNGLSG
jgi:hypothetical protein